MENRHNEALRRIAQADEAWTREGHEPRTFLLIHRGNMQKQIDHPRWDSSWWTPGESTIDDLQELGLLRVDPIDPSRNKARTFSLTIKGREAAAALAAQTVEPVGDTPPTTPTPETPSSEQTSEPVSAVKAVVSWAHGGGDWQATVAVFAYTLCELGIDADLDLFHLHDPAVVWTTYGPRAIDESEFVLIPVSAAYKERWEGTNDPGTGAGAAREANTLKALFDEDQAAFHRKVKLIILPGATTDDIPAELKAAVQRFPIVTIDERGLEDLLRTLTGQPAFVPPPVGNVPLLPPKSVRPVGDATPAAAMTEALAEAVAGLPDREKLVIALTYYERLTRDEIAQILDMTPNLVSQLAQDATTALGEPAAKELREEDQDTGASQHSAHVALLADGPRQGEQLPIEPGQAVLAVPERFDFDQGYAEVTDHYAYDGRTGNDPDTVVFTFRHQEHQVNSGG